MYVDRCEYTTKYGVAHVRYLLRESFRENGKVMHRTILNLTPYGEPTALAIQLALTHRREFAQLARQMPGATARQGRSIGAVWVLFQLAGELGLVDALGPTRQGKLALWQILARSIDQGSRLSAVRLAVEHAACDILDLETFDEDDLYENLDWLTENQTRIEQRLFRKLASGRKTVLAKPDRFAEQAGGERRASIESDSAGMIFLYDVTSSYFEGKHNDLAAFGYNRDGKRGKLQVVAGLLCNGEGVPLSIELFRGNTQDPRTMEPQIRKAAARFDAEHVVFVGDRGMIKGPQMRELGDAGFHYITAITKPQIESLLRQGVIQMELFDEELAEVIQHDDGDGGDADRAVGWRYILRRNPQRAAEMAYSRNDKRASIARQVALGNAYLAEHSRASVATAYRKVTAKIARLKLSGWLSVLPHGRHLVLKEDAAALAEASKLDGCYCLTTDLKCEQASKDTIHGRYKDLARVEWAFRTSKTTHLELRPIHVRKESRTRGHALVVMLAYRLIQELARRWRALDMKVEEGLNSLATLCATEVQLSDSSPVVNEIPRPRASVAQLISLAGVSLPEAIPSKGVRVSTKKKLPSRRK
jgi:hypothetical protein